MDVSAQVTMKDAAKCDKLCEWQNSANQQNAERILHSQVTPESMSKSGRLFSNAKLGARSIGASSVCCVCVCQRRSSVDALKFVPFRVCHTNQVTFLSRFGVRSTKARYFSL